MGYGNGNSNELSQYKDRTAFNAILAMTGPNLMWLDAGLTENPPADYANDSVKRYREAYEAFKKAGGVRQMLGHVGFAKQFVDERFIGEMNINIAGQKANDKNFLEKVQNAAISIFDPDSEESRNTYIIGNYAQQLASVHASSPLDTQDRKDKVIEERGQVILDLILDKEHKLTDKDFKNMVPTLKDDASSFAGGYAALAAGAGLGVAAGAMIDDSLSTKVASGAAVTASVLSTLGMWQMGGATTENVAGSLSQMVMYGLDAKMAGLSSRSSLLYGVGLGLPMQAVKLHGGTIITSTAAFDRIEGLKKMGATDMDIFSNPDMRKMTQSTPAELLRDFASDFQYIPPEDVETGLQLMAAKDNSVTPLDNRVAAAATIMAGANAASLVGAGATSVAGLVATGYALDNAKDVFEELVESAKRVKSPVRLADRVAPSGSTES